MSDARRVSWMRISMMVVGIVIVLPALTLLFGFYGFLGSLFFLLLVAIAT